MSNALKYTLIAIGSFVALMIVIAAATPTTTTKTAPTAVAKAKTAVAPSDPAPAASPKHHRRHHRHHHHKAAAPVGDVSANQDPEATTTSDSAPTESAGMTSGEDNALRSAQEYL